MKGYFPHNWQKWKDVPDEFFQSITYEDFDEWKISNWELPESVFCIIRVENKATGKVKELVYSQPAAAHKKLLALVEDPDNEVTICDNDAIHLISQEPDEL